jgi:hypothetical protein
MKPSYEEALKGTIQWRSEYKDIGILVSFHGYREGEYQNAGTWCYYLLIDERMFNAKDWKKMWFKSKMTDWGLDHDYYAFPDVDFHGGITFYEQGVTYERKTGKKFKTLKVGCDYAHYWDMERGYPDYYDSVLFDAKHSVSVLLNHFPDVKWKCAYSGIWDDNKNFYVAKNGKRIHNSMKDSIEWDDWKAA